MADSCIQIAELKLGLKDINVQFKILEKCKKLQTKNKYEEYSFKVGDRTASINCSLWGEASQLLKPGDIVKATKCFTIFFKNELTLCQGIDSKIEKIKEFTEKVDMSKTISDQTVPNSIFKIPYQNLRITVTNPEALDRQGTEA